MFGEIFQCQESEVKECGLKRVNEVKALNFLAGGPKFLATPLGCTLTNWFRQSELVM